MPKELFNQPLIVSPAEPADDDRVALGQPTVAGGKNVKWVYLKELFSALINDYGEPKEHEFSVLEGQTNYVIPGVDAGEIGKARGLWIGGVYQPRDAAYYTMGTTVVAGDTIILTEAPTNDTSGYFEWSNATGGGVSSNVTKVTDDVNLGAFDPSDVDLSQSGFYNDYTLSGNLVITQFSNLFGNVNQMVKITFAGESLTVPSGTRLMREDTITITPDAGDYELYFYVKANIAHAVLVPYVTSVLPQLSTPVITVVADSEKNTITLSSIDGNATGGNLESHNGDLNWQPVTGWTYPTSPFVDSGLTNGVEIFYRFSVTAAGYTPSDYATGNGTPAGAFHPSQLSPDYFDETVRVFDGGTFINTAIDNTPFTKDYFHVFIKIAVDDGQPAALERLFGAATSNLEEGCLLFLNTDGKWTLRFRGNSSNGITTPALADGAIASSTYRFSCDLTTIEYYIDGVSGGSDTAPTRPILQSSREIYNGASNADGAPVGHFNGTQNAIFIWGGDTDLTAQNILDLQAYFDSL